jgi:uncharacterized protein involved in exopolysaccharide biosynthesis
MNEKTLYDYWMTCYRRRLSILVLMASAVAGTLFIGASLPSIYEARAMFYVPTSATTQRSNAGETSIPLPASNQDDAKANIGILKGRDALRAIHAAFPGKSIDALQRDVDFTAGRDGIVHVYVRDRNPAQAAAIANAYAGYFNRFLIEQMQQRSTPKLVALKGRIAEVSRQLQDIVATRRTLGALTGSPSLEGEAFELVKEREDLNRELDELRGSIAARSSAEMRGERTRLAATPAVDELERQLAQIDLDLAKARVQTMINHPDQVALVERREVARVALQQKLNSLNAGDQARAQTVQSMLAKREQRMQKIPEYQNKLGELDQQYRDLRSAMSFLKNNLEEVSLSSIRTPQVGISVETAETPASPVFPIAWLNVVVAMVVSLLAGVLYALLLDYIDESARRRMELAQGSAF